MNSHFHASAEKSPAYERQGKKKSQKAVSKKNKRKEELSLNEQQLKDLEDQLVLRIMTYFKDTYNYSPFEKKSEEIFYSPIGEMKLNFLTFISNSLHELFTMFIIKKFFHTLCALISFLTFEGSPPEKDFLNEYESPKRTKRGKSEEKLQEEEITSTVNEEIYSKSSLNSSDQVP